MRTKEEARAADRLAHQKIYRKTTLDLRKETHARVVEHAAAAGESVRHYIITAVEQRMNAEDDKDDKQPE